MEVTVAGVTGVYSNIGRGILTVVFRGEVVGGDLQTSDETEAVGFHRLEPENVAELVTRSHFRARVLDAMRGEVVPYEAFRVRPEALLERVGD